VGRVGEDPREDVGIGVSVGVVECGLHCAVCSAAFASRDIRKRKLRPRFYDVIDFSGLSRASITAGRLSICNRSCSNLCSSSSGVFNRLASTAFAVIRFLRTSQKIGWEERPTNDLFRVRKWDG